MRKGEVIFHSLIIFIVLIPEPVSVSNPHKLIKQYFSEEATRTTTLCSLS